MTALQLLAVTNLADNVINTARCGTSSYCYYIVKCHAPSTGSSRVGAEKRQFYTEKCQFYTKKCQFYVLHESAEPKLPIGGRRFFGRHFLWPLLKAYLSAKMLHRTPSRLTP